MDNRFNLVKVDGMEGMRWYHLAGDANDPARWMVSVTEVLSIVTAKKLQQYWQKTEPEKQAKTLGKAQNSGIALHDLIEQDLRGGEIRIPEEYSKAFENWGELKKKHEITAEATELALYSDFYGVAGTLDILGTLGGKPAIFDLKTGGYYAKASWQLGAYRMMWRERTNEERIICGINVKADGSEAKILQIEHNDWVEMTFLAALHLWKAQNFGMLKKIDWHWLHESCIVSISPFGDPLESAA